MDQSEQYHKEPTMNSEQSLVTQTTNSRAAPGPRRYPVLGMLPHLRNGPHEFFLRTALEYGGVAQLGRPDRLLIAHPDGIKHVLVDNHRNYIKGKYTERLRMLIGNGLPVADGESWLQQRRLMQPAFHHQRLESLATAIIDLTAAMLDRWQAHDMRERSFDVATEMRYLTQQIVVGLMFGAEIDSRAAETVGQAFAFMMEYFHYRNSNPFPLPEHWPTWRNRRLKHAQQQIERFVNRLIEEQHRSVASADNLISMLLAARDQETGVGMTDRQLFDEVRTIFFSGYDTTSNVLAWVWYSLAQHPDVERRLHRELAEVLGGRTPTFQDLPNLAYVRMIIEETMRLYPPAWSTGRTVVADDQIDGYHIPAGAKVIVSPYVTHRLPAFWEHPDTFDPQRFAPEQSAGRDRYAYFPFGGGPRFCIGNNLAMLEAQLIVAMVAQNYRLCLDLGHSVQVHSALILQPRHGIRMTRQPRSSQ
jgi:cytochrome P450